MVHLDSLPVVAARIATALDFLIEALDAAVESAFADHERQGYDPADDPALVCGMVRRFVRERAKPMFPDLAEQNGNMSPVHLDLGPYKLKMVHARDGDLPPARTETRRQFYAANDSPPLVLNVFPPDGLVILDANVVEANTLVLVWDAKDSILSQATLYRPSFADFPGEQMNLLTPMVTADDLDIGRSDREAERQATGTDDGDDFTDGGASAESDDEP